MKINKNSKRKTTRLREKIKKKVAEHDRKQKKKARKVPSDATRKRKDPGIPNSLPFKDVILKEAEDRKIQLEEDRQKAKANKKKARQMLLNKKRGLDGLVVDAQKRAAEFAKKQGNLKVSTGKDYKLNRNVESSLKTFYKEFRKVVDAADVVLEVLDARDPLGSRCHEMEQAILSSGTNKRLVLILNKIDLVPKDNVEAWLKHLKNEFPVLAFKASTQVQNDNLSRKKMNVLKANEDLLKTSNCLGAETLMTLLGNYCRNKDIKTSIRVGVVGFPNTGKSSIINSLKRSKTCNVGAMPGITKQMQEVHLDKHIRLLDSPGVVMASGASDTSTVLRNCVKVETLEDCQAPVEAILKRCNKQQMMLHYCMPEYNDVSEFLSLLAKRLGRLKKGGVPDVTRAAKAVLQDWNSGKITYYTHPPEQSSLSTHVGAEFITQMGAEFDIDGLMGDQQKVIDSLSKTSTKHMLVESLGIAKIAMTTEDIDKVTMETNKEQDESEEEEEEDDENMSDDEDLDDLEEMETVSDGEDVVQKTTVTLPSNAQKSRAKKRNSKYNPPTKKESRLNPGLPQLNKQRKKDFKQMKKNRKRRDKVAGELSDALTTAFAS